MMSTKNACTILLILIGNLFLHSQINQLNWVKALGGEKTDEAYGIVNDSKGNVIISGNFVDNLVLDGKINLKSRGSLDGFVVKMDAQGKTLWQIGIGGKSVDEVNYLSIDKEDNVYLTGGFADTMILTLANGNIKTIYSRGFKDAFVCKINNEGKLVWCSAIHGKLEDFARRSSVDAKGEYLYVTGLFQGDFNEDTTTPGKYLNKAKGANDVFFSKINISNGNIEWLKTAGGKLDEFPGGVLVKNENEIIFIGNFMDQVDFDVDSSEAILKNIGFANGYILSLSSEGHFNWVKAIYGSNLISPLDILQDKEKNMVITGTFRAEADFDPGNNEKKLTAPGVSGDAFILKLDENANYIWAKQFGSQRDENGLDLALDNNDNIYFTGCYQYDADFDPGPKEYRLYSNNENNNDIYVCKINKDGDFVWAGGMNGNGSDIGFGICVDENKNVFTTGVFWQTVNFNPGPDSILVDALGRGDAFVFKISQNTVAVKETKKELAFSVFPTFVENNELNVIWDSKSGDNNTKISIVDVDGRILMEEYVNSAESIIWKKYVVNQFGSGVYYLQLINGDRKGVEKFVVMK